MKSLHLQIERLCQRLCSESDFEEVVDWPIRDGGLDGHGVPPDQSVRRLVESTFNANGTTVRLAQGSAGFSWCQDGSSRQGLILSTGTFHLMQSVKPFETKNSSIELVDGEDLRVVVEMASQWKHCPKPNPPTEIAINAGSSLNRRFTCIATKFPAGGMSGKGLYSKLHYSCLLI